MVQRRMIIIGIDGLEYNLVKKYNLKGLMQARYGYFEVSRDYFNEREKVPYTPIIWATIVSGLKPSEHKIRSFFTYGKLLDKVRNLPIIRYIRNKRVILSKFGIKPRMVSLKGRTIFDKIKNSVAVYVPGYNDDYDLHLRLAKAIKRGVKEYEEEILSVHRERMNETLKKLDEEWQLFMTYFDILDLYGHIWFVKYPHKLRVYYWKMDKLVRKIKKIVGNNTLVLIISDHGMEAASDGITGNHSKRAFWSLNKDINWTPGDFTDIYDFVINYFT